MTRVIHSKALASGGIFMCISAALHVFAILVAGFYVSAILLLLVGLALAQSSEPDIRLRAIAA